MSSMIKGVPWGKAREAQDSLVLAAHYSLAASHAMPAHPFFSLSIERSARQRLAKRER